MSTTNTPPNPKHNEQLITREEIKAGAILTPPEVDESVRCRVDRIEGGEVHLTALDNKKYKGQEHFNLSMKDLTNQQTGWRMSKRAA